MSIIPQQNFDDRLDALESRNAFQDHVIEQLNQELAIHQEQIAELKAQLRLLAGRVKDLKGGSVMDLEDETPPPHY
jgi:SlyX protein